MNLSDMTIFNYQGCGECPVIGRCKKGLPEAVIHVRHVGGEIWDNWGRMVQVFNEGDIVKVSIKHDDTTIYCGIAEASRYPGVEDFIRLTNFEDI